MKHNLVSPEITEESIIKETYLSENLPSPLFVKEG
jgi:hypothetical protein